MAKRVTIKDIARKTGVTPTTVSMVIHNHKSIPPETRDKVLAAIKELKYFPNYTARSLVSGRTNAIGVMSDFFYPPFFQELLKGIESRTQSTDFHINHYAVLSNAMRKQKILSEIFFGKQVDCLITFNIVPDPEILAEFKENDFPLVIIETAVEGFPAVTCDNYRGSYLATEYLLKQGRKQIIILTGSLALANNVETRRLDGYRAALADYGLNFSPQAHYETGHSIHDSAACFTKILSEHPQLDAIFCAAGDSCAMGLIHAARQKGLRIPADLAIVGYDDQEVASFTYPPLTTIRQPGIEMGEAAVEMALESLAKPGKGQVKQRNFQPQLIIRESV